MAFKLDDEKNWGEFVHEHALDEMADQVEANRVKNVEQDQRLDEHDQHLAKLDEDLATETQERKAADEAEKAAREAADEAEKEAREQADEAEKQAREQADQEEKAAREAADEAEKEAREQADADEAQARQSADEGEQTAREQADQEEKTARETADEAEKEAREKADADEAQARQDADTAEQTAREQADQGLQTQVTANTTKNTEQGTRLGSIESKNADQDNRLANNDEKDAEQDTRLTNNDTRDNQQDARLDGLETKNTTQDSRLSALEAKPDEDIYPTLIEFVDQGEEGRAARIKITQNDESKSIEESLPLPTLDYEDETGKLSLSYLNTESNVTLPKTSVDTTPIEKSLFEVQAIHQYENTVFTAMAAEGVHQRTEYYISKNGGLAKMDKLELGGYTPAYNLYGLFRTDVPASTSINATVLNFLDLNDLSVYYADIPSDGYGNGKDTSQHVEYFASPTTQNFNTPNIPNNRINWTILNSDGKTFILALAKTNTVLYSQGSYVAMTTQFSADTGFNENSAGPLAFNLEAVANNYKLAKNIQDEVVSKNQHTQGLIDLMEPFANATGDIEIPLTFIPRYNLNNISEIEVSAQIESQVGEIPTGYELRMYELSAAM